MNHELKKIADKTLEKTHIPRPVDMYGDSFNERCTELFAISDFNPTVLSEFAAGYSAALQNVRKYGMDRVSANAQSGIPK